MVFTCNNDELAYEVIKKIRSNKFCNLTSLFGKFSKNSINFGSLMCRNVLK